MDMNLSDRLWSDEEEFARFVAPLEAALGYTFGDKLLLREALTTEWYLYETLAHADDAMSHASLTLVGGIVLEDMCVHWAYGENKNKHALLRMIAAVRETERLSKLAEQFGIEKFTIPVETLQSSGFGSPYTNHRDYLAQVLKAVIGAWSLDNPLFSSLENFLEHHIFSQETIKDELVLYGLSNAEMTRLKAAYPTLWVKDLTRAIFLRLGTTFRLKPRFRMLARDTRDELPVFRAGLCLGDHVLCDEWGRTKGVAKRYALFRCALKLLDGDEWIKEHLDNCRWDPHTGCNLEVSAVQSA